MGISQHLSLLGTFILVLLAVLGYYYNCDFGIDLSPNVLYNDQGSTSSMKVEVHPHLFYDKDVRLKAESVPQFIHINFEPDVVNLNKSDSQVTISSDDEAPPGEYEIPIVFYGADERKHSCNLSLRVHASEPNSTSANSIGMEFVRIPVGEFMMGSPNDEKYREKDEGRIHEVTIEKPFYLGKFEVTQEQWQKIMGYNPSGFKGENLPVESVSWNDAQEFIKKLNEKESTHKYRLPSEAEWEYACRAGSKTQYSFGDDESKLGDYAWYLNNSDGETHPVGQKKPNPWGLYDMYGNIYEWVQDTYHSNYSSAPSDGSAWVSGGYSHVARGSSFNRRDLYNSPATAGCRSANRGGGKDTELDDNGFRLLAEI